MTGAGRKRSDGFRRFERRCRRRLPHRVMADVSMALDSGHIVSSVLSLAALSLAAPRIDAKLCNASKRSRRMGVVHLKLEAELPHLRCNFDAGEELSFRYESTPPVVVSLKRATPKDEAPSAGSTNTICTSISIVEVTPSIEAELCGSLEDNVVKISTLQPATLKTIDDIFHQIRAVSRSTIIMLNWTHGLDGPPDPYGLSHA